MKHRSLLSKSLWQFTLCAVMIFILSAPAFYLITKQLYAEDMIDIIEAVEGGQGIPKLDLEEDILAGMMLQFIMIFIVISLAFILTQRFLTRRLWKPFDRTLKAMEDFNVSEKHIPMLNDGGVKEFMRLNRSLTALMSHDIEAYRSQKEFTENASHELQTPLAIIRSKLDVLLQKDADETILNSISEMYEINMQMERLNRNLLLLSKIENEQYADMEEIDIVAFMQNQLSRYESIDISFSLVADVDKLVITANRPLLESLVNNLVVNAVRHSHETSDITVQLKNGGLYVSNAAIGPALDKGSIFKRFSSDSGSKGNGLGLAIVKAICDFHKWGIDYQFKDNRHIFSVRFIVQD